MGDSGPVRSSQTHAAEARPAPAVSVLMPVFNAEATLERAVASVMAQDFADWELLLADDGSADGSQALAQRLAATDGRIRVLASAVNTGAAAARNRALAAARGRYIAFLDSDDEWLPGKLTEQLGRMRETGAALSYGGFYRVQQGREQRIDVPDRVDYDRLLRGNVIACLTAVYDSAVLGKIEMPDYRLRQDYALWLTLLRRVPYALGIGHPLGRYHMRPRSLSANKLTATRATWRIYRHHAGLSPHQAALCLGSHLLRRLRNRAWQRCRSANNVRERGLSKILFETGCENADNDALRSLFNTFASISVLHPRHLRFRCGEIPIRK